MNYLFAGDRDIAVHVLKCLIGMGYTPGMLLLPDPAGASHSEALRKLAGLPEDRIFEGKNCCGDKAIACMRELRPDYLFSIHYPHLLPDRVLQIPSEGSLNLHPAFLPFNRGWHTPSWSILDGTPAGATLHMMSDRTDAGEIVHQKRVQIAPDDTAHTLYKKIKQAEVDVFQEALPRLAEKRFRRVAQRPEEGTFHKKEDLERSGVQEIDLQRSYTGLELLNKLRALTTSDRKEAAWFRQDGRRFRVQVTIREDPEEET